MAAAASVVRAVTGAWRPLDTPGTSVKVLRHDRTTGASSALIRFEPGTKFPAHDHPGGEEIYVLEGDVQIGGAHLTAGDYLYTPPGGRHAAASDGGCVFLVIVLRPIEFLNE